MSDDGNGTDPVAKCTLQGGILSVFEDRVEIERTSASMFEDKTIPMSEITGIEYSPGLMSGHIQLQLTSMEPATGGFLSHPVDENTLYFGRNNRDCAAEVRDAILERASGDPGD